MNSLHTPTLPFTAGSTTTCANCGKSIRYQNGAPLSAFAATDGSGSMRCYKKSN
jgi:hypothetical protein